MKLEAGIITGTAFTGNSAGNYKSMEVETCLTK